MLTTSQISFFKENVKGYEYPSDDKISNGFVMLGPFIFMRELNKVSADIFYHLLYRRHSVIEGFLFCIDKNLNTYQRHCMMYRINIIDIII